MSFTKAELSALFEMRPDGTLIWIAPPKYHPDLIGLPAGSVIWSNHNHKKYWAVQINGKKVRRGQIVFCLTHGSWPTLQIDHINGNSLDDRPENLREATQTQNAWNHKKRSKKSPYPMGVRRTTYGRFVARIAVNKKQITIGCFSTPEEAATAYQSARRQHFGEFA